MDQELKKRFASALVLFGSFKTYEEAIVQLESDLKKGYPNKQAQEIFKKYDSAGTLAICDYLGNSTYHIAGYKK